VTIASPRDPVIKKAIPQLTQFSFSFAYKIILIFNLDLPASHLQYHLTTQQIHESHQHAFHSFRHLQDHLGRPPATFGSLPRARLRSRSPHQHPVDHPWLYSWNHPRIVRIALLPRKHSQPPPQAGFGERHDLRSSAEIIAFETVTNRRNRYIILKY
jgi:hypothetical protein